MMDLTTVNFALLKEEVQNCFYHDIYKLGAKLYEPQVIYYLCTDIFSPVFFGHCSNPFQANVLLYFNDSRNTAEY